MFTNVRKAGTKVGSIIAAAISAHMAQRSKNPAAAAVVQSTTQSPTGACATWARIAAHASRISAKKPNQSTP
jgi:hypothetical protein